MADGEQTDKDNRNASSPHSHRRPYRQNRGTSFYRGRGRGNNPSVSKALYLFGVRDLREVLDKRHEEQEQTTSGPPPDPSYNYLKDPARESTSEPQAHIYHRQHPDSRGHFSRGPRGYNRGQTRENRHPESSNWKHPETPRESSYIQNPVNIKVEVLTTTGERSYKIDEETKLGDIKHVPNYNLRDLRHSRNEGNRGRGGGPERFDRGRGRGQRGGRRGGRGGRGDRGGGRGQGRNFSSRNKEHGDQPQPQMQQTTTEVSGEENWDSECVDHSNRENVENDEIKQEDEAHDYEEEYVEGQDHGEHQENEEENEEGVYSETNQLEQSPDDSGINLEENLVITSSNGEEKEKRNVKFKDEQSNDATPIEKIVKENKDNDQENPKNETNEATSSNK